METWTGGYVADVNYIYGYYPELNPMRAQLALCSAGIIAPKIEVACELGFGQGLSINLHAAASDVEWYGTDFNPAQAAFAQQLAQQAKSQAHLFDQSFEAFCQRLDLPDFDYIGLHGIWSWISNKNRAILVDFVQRKLKVGGVLYVSYNTYPGWAATVPLRELMLQHTEFMGSEQQGVIGKIDAAIEFAERLFAVNPRFASDNPQVGVRLKSLKNQNRNYLAHEYFNRDWQPMSFAQISQWLAEAKVQYAGSAHYQDYIDNINLTKAQQELLARLPSGSFYQTVRDFCVNQQFRRDYWIKGTRKLSALEKREQLYEIAVVLTQLRSGLEPKIVGSLSEAKIQPTIFNPLLDCLADNKPKQLGQLVQALKNQKITAAQVLQAALLLSGSGALQCAQGEAAIQSARKKTDALNQYLMQKARSNAEINYLASPVTGGGISVPRFHQLFLLGYQQRQQPKSISAGELAQFAWRILSSQGQRLTKAGKPLETAEANLAELKSIAEKFLGNDLSVYQALQII